MNDKTRIARAVVRAKRIGRLIGTLLIAYGMTISASHLYEDGEYIGLNQFESLTLFVLVDVVFLYGKVLNSRHLVASTRRNGRRLMALGGTLSLIGNVAAGLLSGSTGRAFYGAGLVVIIALIEIATMSIKGKTVNTEPRTPRAPAAPVTTPARNRKCGPGCTCGKHSARNPVSPAGVNAAGIAQLAAITAP